MASEPSDGRPGSCAAIVPVVPAPALDEAGAAAPDFTSLLSPERADRLPGTDVAGEDLVSDLNLDQVIQAVAADRGERDLITRVLYRQVRADDTLRYRHDIFRDLEEPGLRAAIGDFGKQMRQVRGHLRQLAGMRSAQQKEGWFLDAASIYCGAVRTLAAELSDRQVQSRGLRSFRDYLARYAVSPALERLDADTAERKKDLSRVMYLVMIRGLRVEVSRYDGDPDYSAEVEDAFARFQQGEVGDYRVQYRTWPAMTHVGEQILTLVARLFRDEFTALADYCRRYTRFVDPVVDQFDRELQFYQSYLDYIAPMRAVGLPFCYPDLTASSKEVFARETFDVALAAKLTATGATVVTNEFQLTGPERVMIVSGPNQGGKTTFARTFGQLHHLASAGCPVPGSSAQLFLFDKILTHFEREEDIANETGKLEDDLLRIQRALLTATPSSIVIMNEIFASTTLSDARFLGDKVLTKVIDLDLLCLYVTFVDELASRGPTVVSMTSTVVPGNPAERTYKVVRKPADGLAYALAIADKHGVTYDQLKRRLNP